MNEFEELLCSRNDIVDNAVYGMILDLTGKTEEELPWNMEIIGTVADAVEGALTDLGIPICRPFYVGEAETPCYLIHGSGDCSCEQCPLGHDPRTVSEDIHLPVFKVGVTRTGYTDVHAENEAAALEAVNSLSDADFYWPPDNWSRDDAFIVREDSNDPSK